MTKRLWVQHPFPAVTSLHPLSPSPNPLYPPLSPSPHPLPPPLFIPHHLSPPLSLSPSPIPSIFLSLICPISRMRIQREKFLFVFKRGTGGGLIDVKEATETNKYYRGNNFVGNSPMPRDRLGRRLHHTQLFSNPTRMRKYPDNRLHKITNTLDRNIARPVY